MFHSLRYAKIVIRFALAIVFIWLGIDKFIHPDYWLGAWFPDSISALAMKLNFQPLIILYLIGFFEIIIAGSLIVDAFMGTFAILGALYVFLIVVFHGFSQVIIKDIGLIGALIALSFWPDRRLQN